VAELLVDTDVFVDHLRGARRLDTSRGRLAYSVVTRCELFAGAQAQEDGIRRLLAPFREIPVDHSIAERAGRLRRQTETSTPDALIAATALEHGLPLITRNTRHFEGVPGLRLQAPKE
jgi:predicted nucleic acid-binding protein